RPGSTLVVLVVAAPPDAFTLVAPLGSAVEPLVHTPQAVQAARIGGIGVVGNSVLEHKCTHAWPLANVRGHVGPGHERVVGDWVPRHAVRHTPVVTHLPRVRADSCILCLPRAVAPAR